jgi:hypothetical protein
MSNFFAGYSAPEHRQFRGTPCHPQPAPAKRGPAPRLQQHLERISALPKPRQRAVLHVIEAMLAQQGR